MDKTNGLQLWLDVNWPAEDEPAEVTERKSVVNLSDSHFAKLL
ncbi:MAG: hypothetical protein ACTS6A_02145 [Candidatus Hodgkinia cicadicola]